MRETLNMLKGYKLIYVGWYTLEFAALIAMSFILLTKKIPTLELLTQEVNATEGRISVL